LSELIIARLAAESIRQQKLYFSGDDWQEFASFGPPPMKTKRVFATFTYQKNESCFYGVAEVVETYNFSESKYGAPEVKLQKDLPVPCTDL
jgi:hypothetical protein